TSLSRPARLKASRYICLSGRSCPPCLSCPSSPRLSLVAFHRRRRTDLARPDVLRLAGAQIKTVDVAHLRLRVDDVRILGIAARLEAVAAADDVPVARPDAPAVHRA